MGDGLDQQSKFHLTLGRWVDLQDFVLPVRHQVFVQEQNVPLELERDVFDAQATHALVTKDGLAVATGRVVQQAAERLVGQVGRIGRLAVLKPLRGQGLGKWVLSSLIEHGRSTGLQQFELHARLEATPLYSQFGFEPCGEVFDEAGADHVLMVLESVR